MRTVLIMGFMLVFISAACSPSGQIVPTPTIAPTIAPTAAPTAILENPPPCPEAELVYYPPLGPMLLVNCVEDPSKENPNVIWGWDGTQWQDRKSVV